MAVRDHDEVGLRETGVVRLAPGIDMDDFAPELEHHASVVKRSDLERAFGGFDHVSLPVGRHGSKPRGQGDQKQWAHGLQVHRGLLLAEDSIAEWCAWDTERYRSRNTKTADCCNRRA